MKQVWLKRGYTESKRTAVLNDLLSTKKDAQLESCELCFIWGKMRTAAQETASQIALRDCSKKVVGEGQSIKLW